MQRSYPVVGGYDHLVGYICEISLHFISLIFHSTVYTLVDLHGDWDYSPWWCPVEPTTMNEPAVVGVLLLSPLKIVIQPVLSIPRYI